jgi:hypothetical protein
MHAQTQFEPKPEVAGVTMDSKGVPIRKTNLVLVSLATNAAGDPMPAYSTVSASDGKFEFYGIPPGRYRLLADHGGYLRTNYGAKTQWGSGTVLTLRQGVPIAGLEIRLPEQAVISGKVIYDGIANSLSLALLQEKYQDGQRQTTAVSSATADSSGEFRFNRLTPGRYYLLASPMARPDTGADEEIGVQTYYPGVLDQAEAEPITVRGGQSVSVELTVQKSRHFRVSGTVSDLPPNGARMALTMRPVGDATQIFSSALAGADGKFHFDSVTPGSYILIGSAAGPTPRLVQQPISVQDNITDLFVTAEQYPPLRGSVKVEGGSGGTSWLRVMLRSAPPAFQAQMVQAGADGSFVFGPIFPGRYRYQFMNLPPGAYLKSAKLGDKDALSGIDLTDLSPDARLEFVISYAGALIEGAIVDEQGKAAEGTATLVPDPPQPEQPWLYQTAEAGDGGQFQFQGVRPGKYRLYAWEELEPGSYMDPQVTAAHDAEAVAIEVKENETKKVAIKRIPVEMPPASGSGGR